MSLRSQIESQLRENRARGIDFGAKADVAIAAIDGGTAQISRLAGGWRITAGGEVWESITLLPTLVKFANSQAPHS